MNPSPWASEEPVDPHVVEIERARLREIRSRLPEAARPLDNALPGLVSLTVAESAFTSFTYSLALAYNEVEAFTIAEVRHRADDVVRIQDGMTASLTTWQDAEQASILAWK
ncbi:hypothetical protein ITP53_50665 [Nonomuraea sp. K274]|uniref:Uncharacterized protein n=1 Tax=Nonomuraea cypriaca TaxID=1187855 RepID=A0A931AP25_9ACTN|nr:hypothetical protein [Nonomuraea cypriaca]MBF8193810.1 hypothetical protein [Nonomuraea cypriaca]